MNTTYPELDRHLQALFGRLDTRPDFDARLMARLRAESHTDATERAMRVRQQERVRYQRARQELQSWRRSMVRLLTLDTLGISLMLLVAVVTAWPHFRGNALEISRQYGPYMAMALAIVIAIVPLLGMWAEHTRRPAAN